jgi:hypothetical protein
LGFYQGQREMPMRFSVSGMGKKSYPAVAIFIYLSLSRGQLMEEVDNKKRKTGRFAAALKDFAQSLDALRDFVAVVTPTLTEYHAHIIDEHRGILLPVLTAISNADPEFSFPVELQVDEHNPISATKNNVFSVIKSADGSYSCDVPEELVRKLASASKKLGTAKAHTVNLYRSSLISLISTVEWFLSQILREYFELFPSADEMKAKSITFAQLSELSSIEEAKQLLMDQKVDEIMRAGFDEWLKFLTRVPKLGLSYLSPHRGRVEEVFQRRNAIIHNNGLASQSYVDKVSREIRGNVEVGDELIIDKDYLFTAIDVLECNFLLIGSEMWKKVAAKDEERGTLLVDIALERITQDRFSVGEGLSLFLKMDNSLSEHLRTIGTLNYWQAIKWQGKFDSVIKEIRDSDFSAKDEYLQVGRLALLNEDDELFRKLPRVIASGKIDIAGLREWPIFREYRTNEHFLSAIDTLEKKRNGQPKGPLQLEESRSAPNN